MSEIPILHARERGLLPHYIAHLEYFTPLDSLEKVQEIVTLAGMQPGSLVLDLGCGDGRISYILAAHFGMRVVGVDYCAERLEIARARCQGLECEFILADANCFCQETRATYDYAIVIEVLEHLEHPDRVLEMLRPKIRHKLLGSVPLCFPYDAHLQVFDSVAEVRERLRVEVLKADSERVFFYTPGEHCGGEGESPRAAEPVISVDRASKCYRIYAHPQDRLKEILSLGRRRYYREFWALRDVSFEIAKGECVGIVGRNGCGKSTLLQIIAQTLRPSVGTVKVTGRVAALLELGSGFNPEFSGRENVLLNATILGLSQAQIADRFEDIVSFADIGDCLDRPIKTYSSGMVLRLAFSVQVQVQPDVLIIDEALAVGDEAFQRKCIARLRAFQDQGGTVLFVSHDAHAILELCDRAILLDRGEMLVSGAPKFVVEGYHRLLYAPPAAQDAIREQVRRVAAQDCVSETPEVTPFAAVEESTRDGSSAKNSEGIELDSAGNPPRGPVDRAYFNPEMKPTTTIVYDCLGAEILDPHVVTLTGERVNTLLPSEEYVYQFLVRFIRPAYEVRFANGIKSKLDTLISSMSIPYGGIPFVAAGSEFAVSFRFRCLMTPDVYFLNAGVVGVVDGREVYLHRIVDALMIRVSDHSGRVVIGSVDLYSDAHYSERPASGGQVAA